MNSGSVADGGSLDGAIKLWRHVHGDRSDLLQVFTGYRRTRDKQTKLDMVAERYFTPDQLEAAAAWAAQQNSINRDVYFCAHQLLASKRVKENASPIVCLWADVDHADLADSPIKPTAVVESSPSHVHAYARLNRPIAALRAEELNKRWAHSFGADGSGFDLTQLLRVPGTRNYGYADTPDVKLLEIDDEAAYDPDELDRILPKLPTPSSSGLQAPRAALSDDDEDLLALLLERSPAFAALWQGDTSHYADEHGAVDDNKADWGLIRELLRATGLNVERTERLARLSALATTRNGKWDSTRGSENYLRYSIDRAIRQWDQDEAVSNAWSEPVRLSTSSTPEGLAASNGYAVDLTTGEVTHVDESGMESEPPRLAAIPEYPVDVLPVTMREMVRRGAGDGLPAALVGGPALAAAAGAIGPNATFEVRPGAWVERAIVWVANVAPRGAGKSPGQGSGFSRLRTRDADAWQSYQEDLKRWKAAKDKDDRPIDPSLLFTDVNFEAMVRWLNDAKTGAAVWDIDELSRMLRGLGEYKPGGGGDRGRLLELWEGSPWRYTRVGTGGGGHNAVDILIPKPTVVICGGIQTRLNHLLGGEEDGLRPRWLLHLATALDVEDDENVSCPTTDSWADLLDHLVTRRDTTRRWWMSEAARKTFFEFRRTWKRQARGADENASTSAALEKADRQLARVALVLAEVTRPGSGGEVGVGLINSAAAIVDYSLDCWRALPEAAVLSLSRRDAELDKALPALAEWLEHHGGQATPRALQRSAVAGIRTAADLNALLDRYAAVYPGSVERTGTTARGGKPGRIVKAPPRYSLPPRTYPGGFVSADKPTDKHSSGRKGEFEIETESDRGPRTPQPAADKPAADKPAADKPAADSDDGEVL